MQVGGIHDAVQGLLFCLGGTVLLARNHVVVCSSNLELEPLLSGFAPFPSGFLAVKIGLHEEHLPLCPFRVARKFDVPRCIAWTPNPGLLRLLGRGWYVERFRLPCYVAVFDSILQQKWAIST